MGTATAATRRLGALSFLIFRASNEKAASKPDV